MSPIKRVYFALQAAGLLHVPRTTPPAPACASCRKVLCGCPDHHWKG